MKHYCTSLLLLAALSTQAQSTQTITVNKNWLALPVKNGGPKQDLELWADGKKITYINMELAGDNADWISYFDISPWKGKKLEVRTSGNYSSPFKQSDADTNRLPLYKEALRGQFHFSPKRGWTNDPNGMVYYKGEYHLFFQHNPYGREWGNMTWGHAVSKDLLHWKEVGEALYPDATGTMYSGSAVVDRNNTSGLGKQPMVMFYTSAGDWSQGMAWSTDGRTFHKLAKPAVPRINKDNRDPKVIWHAASKSWVMVVWVEREEGLNTIEFLRSPDLKNWTRTSVLNGGKGDDRYLYECPDLFELPTNGFVPEKKWVLTAANGQYTIGSFDGFTFKPEAERLNGQLGRDFYASQTFDAEPKGRRIEIGWWRTHTNKDNMNFNQAMSIPLELQLTLTKDGPRLTRMPVKELESLRTATHNLKAGTLKAGDPNPLANIRTGLTEIRTTLKPGASSEITLRVHGLSIVYAAGKITIDGVTAPAPLINDKLELIIYVDKIGVELFAGKGLLFMPVNKNIDVSQKSLSLEVKGDAVAIERMNVYELKSTW